MPSALKTTDLPMAKDYSSFLSIEGASRKKSPFNGVLGLMGGDMVSLGSGKLSYILQDPSFVIA